MIAVCANHTRIEMHRFLTHARETVDDTLRDIASEDRTYAVLFFVSGDNESSRSTAASIAGCVARSCQRQTTMNDTTEYGGQR